MELETWIRPKRAEREIVSDIETLMKAHEAAFTLETEALPSEKTRVERLTHMARIDLHVLEAERSFRGEMDLGPLLKQSRPTGGPRWFLYPPTLYCDLVRLREGPTITYEFLDYRIVRGQEETAFPNPFGKVRWLAPTILLPLRIRERVRDLKKRGYDTWILYEPLRIRREAVPMPPLPKPDPALLVKAGGRWFVVDLWEDPAVEDPRALGTLREFFVSRRPA